MSQVGGAKRPVVTIVHELPGRVRFRLSEPAMDGAALIERVKGHEGIDAVEYTQVTRSVLVRFDPSCVTREEIVIRLGTAYSIDQGGGAVQVFSSVTRGELSDSAFSSGVLLLVALVPRLAGHSAEMTKLLDTVAGLGTAGAVASHGWHEVKREGFFDPEVFSVVYLLVAMARSGGAALPAAVFTWLTTFARHLVQAPAAGVELKPTQLTSGDDGEESHPNEVVISQVWPATGGTMALTLFSSALRYALTGGSSTGGLLREINTVAKHHGEVLEGLGDLRQGIPVKVQL